MPDARPVARCMGGVLDGQLVPVEGVQLVVPLVTEDSARELGVWMLHHGVAWAAETLDGIPEHPVTPPPPAYPRQRYLLGLMNDRPTYVVIDG